MPTKQTKQFLIAWIGDIDRDAATGKLEIGMGPIAQAVLAGRYDAIHLLSAYVESETNVYVKWLAGKTTTLVQLHSVALSSPMNFGEIYERALEVLEELSPDKANLTYHLSSGTRAMASIWVLLAKTIWPARLITSSLKYGVHEADIPFEIAIEFIPKFLQQLDKRLTNLAQGYIEEGAEFSKIVHHSAAMKRVIAQARRVALHSIPVLIEGESGTGKELMARAIHQASPRRGKPFIPINCGAIPHELVESEFFGHVKGAFTGADAVRVGHFEKANGGTLFLDEVGELPKPIQVKLLRALHAESTVIEITPVGTSESKKVDVRIVAATNRMLINEVAEGNFREDLFYRIAVAIIKLPPLRERQGDISLLIDVLLQKLNEKANEIGINRKKISISAKKFMLQHHWPGNVRELDNALRRAAVWSDDESISLESIKDAILLHPKVSPSDNDILNQSVESGVELEMLMAKVASHYIERALEHTRHNKTKASKLLGFSNYQTLINWMKRYEIK